MGQPALRTPALASTRLSGASSIALSFPFALLGRGVKKSDGKPGAAVALHFGSDAREHEAFVASGRADKTVLSTEAAKGSSIPTLARTSKRFHLKRRDS